MDHFKPTSITQIASSSDHKVKETIDDPESGDLAAKKIEGKTSADDNLPADMLNSEPVNTDPNSQSTLEQKEISDPLTTHQRLDQKAQQPPPSPT